MYKVFRIPKLNNIFAIYAKIRGERKSRKLHKAFFANRTSRVVSSHNIIKMWQKNETERDTGTMLEPILIG